MSLLCDVTFDEVMARLILYLLTGDEIAREQLEEIG